MPPLPKPPNGVAHSQRQQGEDRALASISTAFHARLGPAPSGELWIGDDAAIVQPPSGRLVLAVDAVAAGVHADLELVSTADLGWKALAVAISDIGAMGARPLHSLVTLCVPPETDIDPLIEGLADAALEWNCPVVGGDLTGAEQIVISVAVTGELEGNRPAVARSGASSGDLVFLSGPVGASAAGLRVLRSGHPLGDLDVGLAAAHRRPRARVAEGRTARSAGATAMIDVSDGLALDCHRLAVASGVGMELDDVPVATGATLDEALGGGEDYELVMAIGPGSAGRLLEAFTDAGLRSPILIGRCTATTGQVRLRGQPLPPLGWQHDVGGAGRG
jgi:thiamine-monophosphate kinase